MERPYLAFITTDGPGKVPVNDPVTIGRHADNTIALDDAQASRFHCVISRTDEGLILRDLDSRNGTKVNGEPVNTARLLEGDIIKVGSTEFKLVIPKAPAAKPGSPAAAAPALPKPAPMRPVAKPPQPRKPPQISAQPVRQPASPGEPEPDTALDPVDLDVAAFLQPTSKEDDLAEKMLTTNSAEQESSMADFSVSSGKQDDEKYLPVLAASLPDQSFDVGEIALLNARGSVVHPPILDAKKPMNPAETVTVLRYILLICTRGRATDVHLEPKTDDFQLRLRIDGTMVDIIRLSKQMGVRLSALVKIMCDIDVQHKGIIQEGHFGAFVPGRRIDYRVSFAPSMFGQKLVIRVLDTANAPLHVRDLHLPAWMLDEVQRVSQQDAGMILVVGPTGSGKTTTLYALLRDVGTERRNVLTIEDPVEIEIEGATQIPVNEEKGNSFSSLLRSMLRQDPDVMMVGEVRDAETARIAMQAAMTGHLVLSTIHARDTIGAVFRLLDLGVEPYLVSSSLQVILAQRLARELCVYCKRGMRPTPEQLQKMGPVGKGLREVFIPVGCPSCLKTGFSGRRAFFEMLTTTDELREVILKAPTPRDIEQAVTTTRFARLTQTGYQLVAQGVTAFDEIERTVGRG